MNRSVHGSSLTHHPSSQFILHLHVSGIGVRIVSLGMVGMAGGDKLSFSRDVIDACSCTHTNVECAWLCPLWVCGQ